MNGPDIIAFFVLASLAVIGFFATVMGFLHYRRERLLTHAERMRALELGMPLPDEPDVARLKAVYGASTKAGANEAATPKSYARRCFSTAFWVPVAACLLTQGFGRSEVASVALWGAVALIASTSLVCGTVLALRTPVKDGNLSASPEHNGVVKDVFHDPDTLDVAGRRG